MADTQDNLIFSVTTPLGKDKLLLRGFRGEERMSGLYHFLLDLGSDDPAIDSKKIVGKEATIQIILPDKSQRYLSGIVSRFVQGGHDPRHTFYQIELRPWLWLLSLTTDNRIFQKKKAPDILKAVFGDIPGAKFDVSGLKGTYAEREYCVQYGESSLDFVSRLMEEEGIYYFFAHKAGQHTLMLVDDLGAHKPCPGADKVAIRNQHEWQLGDGIFECSAEDAVTTNSYALTDYNFETPTTDLYVETGSGDPTLKVYEHPGVYLNKGDGEKINKLRLDAAEQGGKILRGKGNVRGLLPGGKFKLTNHARKDLNTDYVVRWVYHAAEASTYGNAFEAMPATVQYRPPRVTPRLTVYGTQTATVVGKKGEEQWTDKYGRVLVSFPWDRKGKKDENNLCWIRVAQGWAGKSYGIWFLPRIGQEVVVTFLDGDPDRPLITGSVYNAQQTVPYALPDNQTKSTIKTNTTKGGAGFNEIRFDDKKQNEEIWIHAQKDLNVKTLNQYTDWAPTYKETHGSHLVVNGVRDIYIHAQKWDPEGKSWVDTDGLYKMVIKKGPRYIELKEGDETIKIKGKRDTTIVDVETYTNKADYTRKVKGDYTLKIDGNLTIDCGGDITIKAGKNYTMKAGQNVSEEAGMDFKLKGGMNVLLEAGMDFKGKGGMNVDLKGGIAAKIEGGVQLSVKGGAMAGLEGGAMATVKGGIVQIG